MILLHFCTFQDWTTFTNPKFTKHPSLQFFPWQCVQRGPLRCRVVICLKRTVPLEMGYVLFCFSLILLVWMVTFHVFWGSHSAKILIFGVKYLRNPTTRGACPHREGRPKELLSFIAIFYAPGGEVPFVVGSVKHFTPNMDIWSQVDPPERENPPQAISNQDWNKEKTYLIFSGRVLLIQGHGYSWKLLQLWVLLSHKMTFL